jgi:hypothetical protein
MTDTRELRKWQANARAAAWEDAGLLRRLRGLLRGRMRG